MNAKLSLKIRQLQFVLCVLIVIMHSMDISGLNNRLEIIQKYIGLGFVNQRLRLFYYFFVFVSNILSSSNTALWFVKQLIVFMILSPLLHKVYKVINLKLFIVLEIISIVIIVSFRFTYYSFIYWLSVYLLGLYLGAISEEVINWINKKVIVF